MMEVEERLTSGGCLGVGIDVEQKNTYPSLVTTIGAIDVEHTDRLREEACMSAISKRQIEATGKRTYMVSMMSVLSLW